MAPGIPRGPRSLLRRLREVMAEPVSAQARLDRIVVLIASNMIAEVCSVYVLRADGNMELYGTEGLNREAVHNTTMKAGEGLVGLIATSAEPLALSDAQSHPAFAYKPETGEEIFHSFLGVPILRGGTILGILVVQNKVRRSYSEEEIEALQTTAMLLAEMIASGELQAIALPGTSISTVQQMHLKGTAIADGVGLGHVFLHQPRVVVQHIVAEDVNQELARLDEAVLNLRHSIDILVEKSPTTGEQREILETFRLIAYDRGWLRRLHEAVVSGLTAEAAVERVQNDARAKLQRQTDPYLRDRLHDLDDLAERLLHQLTGRAHSGEQHTLPENAILVARSMGPAALLEYERSRLRGLILEDGGAASHVAIVARAMGIPCVGDVENITDLVADGDAIIIDGSSGEIEIRPGADVEAAYVEKVKLRAGRQEQYRKLRDVEPVTLDGVRIGLHMNAGLLIDMPHVYEAGAQSIGLFRTEMQFMLSSRFPRFTEQYAFYRSVIEALPDRPITFRTIDIGSDKILPYMKKPDEDNPALGWRGARIGLDRPGIMRPQLRAMLRAAAGLELRIMFPMITTIDEFKAARALVEKELELLKKFGHQPPIQTVIGVMLEVPALLYQLEELCQQVAFISVGANDLLQYLFAADRDNKMTAGRYDCLSPAFLRALRDIVQTANKYNVSVTVCGEMAGRTIEALALIAIGFRDLSMTPAVIGPVKAMVLSLDADKAEKFLAAELEYNGTAASLRNNLRSFAEQHAIVI